MNKERWIGLAVILLIVGFFLVKGRNAQRLSDEAAMGEGIKIEERASEFAKTMGIVLPADVEKVTLEDVGGGSGSGLATRKYSEDKFTHSVLAALEDPVSGSFYEGWLVSDSGDVVYTGKLRVAKGGWVLDFVSGVDLSDHDQVVVTRELVDDQKPEAHVLEGSF